MNEELFNKIKDKMEKEINNKAFNLFMNNFIYTETFLRTICVFITIFAQALVVFAEYNYLKTLCGTNALYAAILMLCTLALCILFMGFNFFVTYSTSKNIISKYIKGFKDYYWYYDSYDFGFYEITLYSFIILSMFWLHINIFFGIVIFITMCCFGDSICDVFKLFIKFLERRD